MCKLQIVWIVDVKWQDGKKRGNRGCTTATCLVRGVKSGATSECGPAVKSGVGGVRGSRAVLIN